MGPGVQSARLKDPKCLQFDHSKRSMAWNFPTKEQLNIMDNKNNESAPRTSQARRRGRMRNRLAVAGLSLALLGGGAAMTIQPVHAAKAVVEPARVGWGG